eukprot:CFRG7910T1
MATVFDQNTCGNLVVSKINLIEVDSESAIKEAVDLMKEFRVQSVPVYDTESSSYLGVVSLFDVLVFSHNMRQKVMSQRRLSAADQQAVRVKAFSQKVKKLIGYRDKHTAGSDTHPLLAVKSTAPVRSVVALFAKGTPRILVSLGFVKSDTSKPLLRVLSATDVIKFIHSEKAQLPELMTMPCESMSESDSYVSIPETTALNDVMNALHESGMDAIGLTNEKGALVSLISVSDVTNILSTILEVGDESAHVDASEPVNATCQRMLSSGMRQPVCVGPKDTFENVIAKMIETDAHRVWMVDKNNLVLGVIRQQDVLIHTANYLKLKF